MPAASTDRIDPRGPQFNATITSIVLAAVLLTAPGPVGIALLAIQAALFASAVLLGVQRTPAAYLFRTVVRPRLGPPTAWEDPRPPRFAQAVGLVFALVGLAGYLSGATLVGVLAVGFALVAAVLNATLRFCLGCRLYGVCAIGATQATVHPSTTSRGRATAPATSSTIENSTTEKEEVQI